VAAEDLAGLLVDDGGGGLVHQDDDAFPLVLPSDAEVVEPAGVAEGEESELVDSVVADAVVAGVGLAAWSCFGGGAVGVTGGGFVR
jgi:hypothetical protein